MASKSRDTIWQNLLCWSFTGETKESGHWSFSWRYIFITEMITRWMFPRVAIFLDWSTGEVFFKNTTNAKNKLAGHDSHRSNGRVEGKSWAEKWLVMEWCLPRRDSLKRLSPRWCFRLQIISLTLQFSTHQSRCWTKAVRCKICICRKQTTLCIPSNGMDAWGDNR